MDRRKNKWIKQISNDFFQLSRERVATWSRDKRMYVPFGWVVKNEEKFV